MKGVKAFGAVNAPYLFVMLSKPSEGLEAWFWKTCLSAGIKKTQVRIVYVLDEPPAGKGNKPLKSQLHAARERFSDEIKRSKAKIVIPMGKEAFYELTGIEEGIFDARGYLIRSDMFKQVPVDVYKQVGVYKNNSKKSGVKKGDPRMKMVKEAADGLLGKKFKGVVIPTFTLDYVAKKQFSVSPAFKEDLKRAHRAFSGTLFEIDKPLTYYVNNDTIIVDGVRRKTAETLNKRELGDIIAIDIETHGVDNEAIDLVSFSDTATTASLEWNATTLKLINKIFALPNRLFVIHNSQFDVPRLVDNGVKIPQEVIDKQIFCSMMGAVIIQPDLHKALGRVATVYLDLSPWKSSSKNPNSPWRMLALENPRAYSAKDALVAAWLGKQEIAVMKNLGCWNLFMGQGEHPGPGVMATMPILVEMTRGGLKIDKDRANKWCRYLERKLFRYHKIWSRMFPLVSPTSTHQLYKLFHKEWGLPPEKDIEDGITTDELTLVKLSAFVTEQRNTDLFPGPWQTDPRCTPRTFELLLRMRDTTKTLNTYVQPALLNESRYVHPQYLPVAKDEEMGGKKMDSKGNTATGRLASYDINIQNQPKKVRKIYTPDRPDCVFLSGDYKSAELYALAGVSGDRKLIHDLQHDMHQLNADRLGISRKNAKNVTYASQYLAGPSKQSEMILKQEHVYIPPAECLNIANGIWGFYTDATAYKENLITVSSLQHYVINPFGRIRFFHSGKAPAAVDFIPQSIVADILWCVLKPVADAARSLGGRIVTTVHDSIVVCVSAKNANEMARQMKAIMEKRFHCVARDFFIPVDIEISEPGGSWGELKKWEDTDAGVPSKRQRKAKRV